MRVRRLHQTLRRRPRSHAGVLTGRAALLASAFRVTEHEVQAAVFRWAMLRGLADVPDLQWLAAIPNGGLRKKATAGKLKAEGVRMGFPDLVLPVAHRGFHGLFLEAKTETGRLDDEQRVWLRQLAAAGYCASAAWGVDAMQYALLWYVEADVSSVAVPVRVELVDGYREWRRQAA